MGTLSVRLPDELEKTMGEFKLDWSEVARKALFERVEKMKRLKRLQAKVSDKDARELTDRISEAVATRFREPQ